MSTNLEYRAIERQRKRESRRQAAKLNEKKGDRDLELEVKNKGDIFLLEEQHETFVVACIASETRREHKKKRNERGGGRERRKRLPANPTI